MAIRTYKKGDNTKLSNNFSVPEFACHGDGCCSTVKIDSQLVNYLQKIRDHFGKPVNISSGYRCAYHNREVGGVSNSKHTMGMAADIYIEGVAPAEIAKYAESIGIKGIGLYEENDGNFVHVDTRTTKDFWYGQAEAYRSTFGGSSGNSSGSSSGYSQDQFIRDVQAACGATVDGIAGTETLSKAVTLSEKKNATHAAVSVVQRRLNALGYNAGTVDGIAGEKFTKAVKAYQKANSCIQDGEITEHGKTWRKLLDMM